eukprot:m.192410 g.192410  ORF g.192410 m.192410 type:complete len:111 (-) comp15653_c0_seq5:472-804(-)
MLAIVVARMPRKKMTASLILLLSLFDSTVVDAVDALEMLRQKRLDELREAARGEEKTDNDIDVPYNMLRNALFKPNRGVVLHLYIFIFVGVCLCFTCIMIKTETGLHSIQ